MFSCTAPEHLSPYNGIPGWLISGLCHCIWLLLTQGTPSVFIRVDPQDHQWILLLLLLVLFYYLLNLSYPIIWGVPQRVWVKTGSLYHASGQGLRLLQWCTQSTDASKDLDKHNTALDVLWSWSTYRHTEQPWASLVRCGTVRDWCRALQSMC